MIRRHRIAVGCCLALLAGTPSLAAALSTEFDILREAMVKSQIRKRGVGDERVLAAVGKVPRHLFVPADLRDRAYGDHPLPIGSDQTISQPYIVALMSEALDIKPGDRVLEIGTGSGYQAAVLAEMGAEVYSIEILPELSLLASRNLSEAGYDSVHLRVGDGYAGWPEQAPFDAVILTAAPPRIPDPLLDQVVAGGVLVAPVGGFSQVLVQMRRGEDGCFTRREITPVRFVPMTGRAQER